MILPATVSIPCFDGSPPVGEHSLTKYTTVVDRKFIPHMPAVLLQIKFKSKGHWTCWLSIPCVQMTLERVKPQPPPLVPNPQSQPSYFSPFFAYGLTACERCEMIHEDTWWHIISVLIRSCFLFLFCFLFSISRYDLCNMWQMWDDTGRMSWWHIISALIIKLRPRYLVL